MGPRGFRKSEHGFELVAEIGRRSPAPLQVPEKNQEKLKERAGARLPLLGFFFGGGGNVFHVGGGLR
jgi:hypothetical protein